MKKFIISSVVSLAIFLSIYFQFYKRNIYHKLPIGTKLSLDLIRKTGSIFYTKFGTVALFKYPLGEIVFK
ncbi:MAG: hypothetical protein CFE24_13935 [Flavobacterium sp. BFFFF2]|nr:MAG: hypothetical protein CFE24_13935 [Flavobacterium sp. BFFFF2]